MIDTSPPVKLPSSSAMRGIAQGSKDPASANSYLGKQRQDLSFSPVKSRHGLGGPLQPNLDRMDYMDAKQSRSGRSYGNASAIQQMKMTDGKC